MLDVRKFFDHIILHIWLTNSKDCNRLDYYTLSSFERKTIKTPQDSNKDQLNARITATFTNLSNETVAKACKKFQNRPNMMVWSWWWLFFEKELIYSISKYKVRYQCHFDFRIILTTIYLLNLVDHHHHHHIVLAARISLTLTRHSSLSFIALGRSSGQQPVSSHSCWMYVRAGRPAFARPCVGIHKSTSLMSSSLLLQQCPACLVRLTWIVFVIGGRWPYSWCLVGCCCQDLLRIARSILV